MNKAITTLFRVEYRSGKNFVAARTMENRISHRMASRVRSVFNRGGKTSRPTARRRLEAWSVLLRIDDAFR
jgi:hypothetical protein